MKLKNKIINKNLTLDKRQWIRETRVIPAVLLGMIVTMKLLLARYLKLDEGMK